MPASRVGGFKKVWHTPEILLVPLLYPACSRPSLFLHFAGRIPPWVLLACTFPSNYLNGRTWEKPLNCSFYYFSCCRNSVSTSHLSRMIIKGSEWLNLRNKSNDDFSCIILSIYMCLLEPEQDWRQFNACLQRL